MPISIGSNIASLTAQRRLSESTSKLSTVYERLSSGQRINRASDDAAGLSISESLKSDVRVFNQGIRNLNDGVSFLTVADGAIESLSNITIRLKELAEQSANGTYSSVQRAAIDKEAQALSKEFTRISQSTKFNGINILNGSVGSGIRLQAGIGVEGSIAEPLGGAIGTGSFTTVSTVIANVGFEPLTADINNDGHADIITHSGTSSAQIYLGNGSGSFGTSTSVSFGLNSVQAIQKGDFNGDGITDLAAVGHNNGGPYGYAGVVSVLFGKSNGSFNTAKTYEVTGNLVGNNLITSGDVNGDGIDDIVTGGEIDNANDPGGIFLGNSNSTLSPAISIATSNYSDLTLADFNGDGLADLVAGGSNTFTVFMATGNGNFGSPTGVSAPSIGGYAAAEVGDVNNDGKLDVFMARTNAQTFFGNGDGTFTAGATFAAGVLSTVHRLADFNGDGMLDFFSSNTTSQVRLGNGDGTFNTGVTFALGTGAQQSLVADLNEDGVQDIITAQGNTALGNTVSGSSALLPFSLKTILGAKESISLFDRKLQQLSSQRGKLGAFLSRISTATNVLTASSENYSAAGSRIKDADIAYESSELLRLNILQQASASVLGQANLQPDIALRLLRN